MRQHWWKEANIYEIYPRSFKDSNGDGIGDLNGIREKLSYLKELGIDAVWICPFYPSPMKDNGYDITDYCAVDPVFGTMEDMKKLLKEAKELRIRIVIDLVLNHTSDQHLWFREAIKDKKSPFRDYYIFREEEEMPSNVRSCFGGPVWTRTEDGSWYYHTFAAEQPDLNWENPRLREEIRKILNFWINLGVDGFRVDAITYIKKGASLHPQPADGEDGLTDVAGVGLNQPGIGEFLKEIKDICTNERDVVLVAEAPGVPYENLKEYIGEDGYFSMIFDFSYADIDLLPGGCWYRQNPWTIEELREKIFHSQKEVEKQGWGAVYLENHDQSRCINKYFRRNPANALEHEKMSKALAVLFMGLRGTPFLYQGQELGMYNYPFHSPEEFDDINSKDQYQRAVKAGCTPEEALKYCGDRSRDNSRTPMQWSDEISAGFSKVQPWFPVHPDYPWINVKTEQMQEDSVYRFYHRLLHLRKENKELFVYGTFHDIQEETRKIIAYERESRKEILQVQVNMTGDTIPCRLREGIVLAGNYPVNKLGVKNTLNPYEAVMILSKKEC